MVCRSHISHHIPLFLGWRSPFFIRGITIRPYFSRWNHGKRPCLEAPCRPACCSLPRCAEQNARNWMIMLQSPKRWCRWYNTTIDNRYWSMPALDYAWSLLIILRLASCFPRRCFFPWKLTKVHDIWIHSAANLPSLEVWVIDDPWLPQNSSGLNLVFPMTLVVFGYLEGTSTIFDCSSLQFAGYTL